MLGAPMLALLALQTAQTVQALALRLPPGRHAASRRGLLLGGAAWSSAATAASANELAQEVRAAVVRSAQLADAIDGKWEQFSDVADPRRLAARGKQKVNPPPPVVDAEFAAALLATVDELAAKYGTVPAAGLAERRTRVVQRVGATFARSARGALDLDLYSRWTVFAEALPSAAARIKFEAALGPALLDLVEADVPAAGPKSSGGLAGIATVVQAVTGAFATRGYIASARLTGVDEAPLDDVDAEVYDETGRTDLLLALDADAGIKAQILLQEQGVLFTPRLVESALVAALARRGLAAKYETYYLDRFYNPNADKYDPQVALVELRVGGSGGDL